MTDDIYDKFLTRKVKVFSTKKGIPALVLPKKVLLKARPFLLASAMMVTAGCRNGNDAFFVKDDFSNDKNKTELRAEWQSVYDEVVKTYHLDNLTEKEPLDGAFIKALMSEERVPELSDVNFNHRIENQDNFWEIVKNGIKTAREVQESPTLTNAQKKEYEIQTIKMLSQISRYKGTKYAVDLSDYNNMKAFLYFEKVVEYKDDYALVMDKRDGWIDERSEAFGRYYQDNVQLREKAQRYSGVEKFAKALYANENRLMMSYQDSVAANALSRKILDNWLKKTEIKDKGLWTLTRLEDEEYCNALLSWFRRGDKLELNLNVDAMGRMARGNYSPVGTIIIHELQHVMQTEPASKEKASDNRKKDIEVATESSLEIDYLAELGPTLYSLALEDGIYKEIHGIEKDEVLDYGTLDMKNGAISLGETAVWFAKMIDKYPTNSVDELLMKKEVIEQLHRWGNGEKEASFDIYRVAKAAER